MSGITKATERVDWRKEDERHLQDVLSKKRLLSLQPHVQGDCRGTRTEGLLGSAETGMRRYTHRPDDLRRLATICDEIPWKDALTKRPTMLFKAQKLVL